MAGLNTRSNATRFIPNSSAAQQLICDLQQDVELQASLIRNGSQSVLELCKARDVYVDPALLDHFIKQLAAEEQEDQELSLEQLEDIAGGLGVADVMVSGLVLAVVASNAGAFINEVQAATGLGDSAPVSSLTANPAISKQVDALEGLGIQIVVGDPSVHGASAQWDPSRRTMTISPTTMEKGFGAVMRSIDHEAVHIAQSCKAGGVGLAGSPLGVAASGEAVEKVQHAVYEDASDHAKHLEVEAYSLTEQKGAGIKAAIEHCSPEAA